jgi:hypothetical protein
MKMLIDWGKENNIQRSIECHEMFWDMQNMI